jgi:superfamily II DNA or RNA helicase
MLRWARPDDELSIVVKQQTAACLGAYREDPGRVESDANIEITTSQGGYGRKQIYELIQNGADAMRNDAGRIEVVLVSRCLYVANQGAPITASGIRTLMSSHVSRKRSDEIGRFGLGFKSVVALTDTPQIFSRSGSFGFDRELAREQIREVVPEAPRFPLLRVAHSLDPDESAEQDSILADLMKWAQTVVRIPLKGARAEVSKDLQAFPRQFVLFSSHVESLALDNRVESDRREITLRRRSDDALELVDRGERSAWRVVRAKHRPSPAAARDAGEIAAREEVEIQWAVPIKDGGTNGNFWAFFPTESFTTLSGIVNAPWKLSDDRRNLLPGPFNEELLRQVLPRMVADSLPSLTDPKNPAAMLDLLPARGREPRSWADGVINIPVMDAVAMSACIPCTDGLLRRPADVRVHPLDAERNWLSEWSNGRRRSAIAWAHPDIQNPERKAKIERLMHGHASNVAGFKDWLEALVDPSDVTSSAHALNLVARIVREKPSLCAEVTEAQVLLLENGALKAPVRGRVFVRNDASQTGQDFIHPKLAGDVGTRMALESLGITVLDRSGELRRTLSAAPIDWRAVWTCARELAKDTAAQILRELVPEPLERNVLVRGFHGRWVALGSAYLAGEIVPASGVRDASALIDPRFHALDNDLLVELGAVSRPLVRHGVAEEPWLLEMRERDRELYRQRVNRPKLDLDRIEVAGDPPPWPLQPLEALSLDGRAALTEAALLVSSVEPWTMQHLTDKSLQRARVPSPAYRFLSRHGCLRTKIGPWPVHECLVSRPDLPDDILPVVELAPRMAELLKLRAEPSELSPSAWSMLLDTAAAWTEPERRFRLYAWAAYSGVVAPEEIRVTVGSRTLKRRPAEVAVTADRSIFDSLQTAQIAAVIVPEEDVQVLIGSWGLADGGEMLQEELVIVPEGTPELLVDVFPPLKLYLPREQLGIEMQRCSTIEILTSTPTGQVSRSIGTKFHENRVLVTERGAAGLLGQIASTLQLDIKPQRVLQQMEEQKHQKLRAEIRACDDDETRLALAVGRDALRRMIPRTAIVSLRRELGRDLEDRELARLSFAVHGYSVLQQHKAAINERGLNAPDQWAGRAPTRNWVADLGFPPEYAGFSGQQRPSSFEVDGPAELKKLHDYQREVAHRIKALVSGRTEKTRGIVALPTGAGKTRVAVQAFTEMVRDEELNSFVVWIAQTDELCEQAVQTWAYIWRAIGPSKRMTITRLWGGNDAQEDPENFQVVVATPETLRNRVDQPSAAWLTEASVIVVDEAHTSVAPQYTRVLTWLMGGNLRRGETPLLGLTATPFRNTNEPETQRLVGRYQSNWLDHGVFRGEPYTELQEQRILARVRQRVLTGAQVPVSEHDRGFLAMLQLSPAIETMLAENEERNRTIVDDIRALDEDWTVLLFATSVENARALAAMLSFRGVPSVAISSDTDPYARRRYIDDFKDKKLRVITNYNVLAQGFDVPAVRAVYVTRPTFSTNLYQQMVGRGLRGFKNGGSDEVLIVNVADNIASYGDQLAFHHFDFLWDGTREG